MSTVRYENLENVCDILDSRRIPITEKDRKPGIYPYYGANGVQDYVDDFIFNDDLVLLAEDGGNFGSTERPIAYRVSGKCWVNNHAHVLKAKDCIDIDYLCYSLMFYNTNGLVNGATRQKLTQAAMRKMLIPLREKEEQAEIVNKVSSVFQLIEKRKQQLSKLDQLVKARFVEMFGDIKTNQKCWNVASFNDFAVIDTSMTTDFEKYKNYPHIGIDSIEKNTGELKGYRTVKEDNVISGKYIFTNKHIIYSKIRPNLNKVAIPTFEGVCSADAYPILPKQEKCSRFFLAYVMRSEFFLDYILQFSARTNLPKVNKKELQGFCMPLPPLAFQEEFAAFVQNVDKTKTAVKQSLEKLETLKKSLMQEYFG